MDVEEVREPAADCGMNKKFVAIVNGGYHGNVFRKDFSAVRNFAVRAAGGTACPIKFFEVSRRNFFSPRRFSGAEILLSLTSFGVAVDFSRIRGVAELSGKLIREVKGSCGRRTNYF